MLKIFIDCAFKIVAVLMLLVVLPVAGLFYGVPAIDAWERANDYPFGKLCDVYNSCPSR